MNKMTNETRQKLRDYISLSIGILVGFGSTIGIATLLGLFP